MSRPRVVPSLVAAFACAALAAPAAAVLIASGDGRANTRPALNEWPWQHAGKRGEFSAVYLGHRWVLTAAHVGPSSVEFAGTEYGPLENSSTTLTNADGSPSDLIAFRIDGSPALPLLPIIRERPAPGSTLILIGNGHDRGEELRWTDESGNSYLGWRSAAAHRMRWGTNLLDPDPSVLTFRGITTAVLAMTFSPPQVPEATPHEAQAVVGDSGGAVLGWQAGHFALAGIMIVRSEHAGQPEGAALYGNRTFAADLSAYRDQLIALTRPDCADERDNDDDGAVDFPNDPGCSSPGSNSERSP